MGETVDKLRSNLTPSNLASEAASRAGVSELSWRGVLDFASTTGVDLVLEMRDEHELSAMCVSDSRNFGAEPMA
jgi:hypothetical protein